MSHGSLNGLGHDLECPWCESVRLKYGSYFYPITAQNAHLFKPPEPIHRLSSRDLDKIRKDAYEAGAKSAAYFGA